MLLYVGVEELRGQSLCISDQDKELVQLRRERDFY